MANEDFIKEVKNNIESNEIEKAFDDLLVFTKSIESDLYYPLLKLKQEHVIVLEDYKKERINYSGLNLKIQEIKSVLKIEIIPKVETFTGVVVHRETLPLKPGKAHFFISYSRSGEKDISIAKMLFKHLKDKGNDVFLDEESVEIGEKWFAAIERALQRCDYFILLISQNSMLSEMVIEEVRRIKKRQDQENENRPVLLPIRIKIPSNYDLPYDLSSYVSRLQHFTWNNDADNHTLTRFIDKIIEHGIKYGVQHDERNRIMIDPHFPLSSAMLTVGTEREKIREYYVERLEDKKCKEIIQRPYSLLRIMAPRQYGKTWLLSRLIQFANREGYESIVIDFQLYRESDLNNLERLLKLICAESSRQLGLAEKINNYFANDNQTVLTKCRDYFERYILAEKFNRPIVFAIDKADKLFKYPSEVTDDFFGMIRSWHEQASMRNNRWENFKIILTYSTDDIPIKDSLRSPFNIGEVVLLSEFTNSQIFKLSIDRGLDLNPNDIAKLRDFSGGHPYLIQKALFEIGERKCSVEDFIEIAHDDNGPFGEHLRRLFYKLNQEKSRISTLIDILHKKRSDNDSDIMYLQAVGLVKYDKPDYKITSSLYKEFFTKKFKVAEHLTIWDKLTTVFKKIFLI